MYIYSIKFKTSVLHLTHSITNICFYRGVAHILKQLTVQIQDEGHLWCDAVLFGRNVLTVLVKPVASILYQKGRGNGFFRNSCYCLSNSVTSLTLSASRSLSLLLLQPQIAQSRSSFQYKLNRQTDERRLFYLKEHYDITIGS